MDGAADGLGRKSWLILADETALVEIAGLVQIERLLLSIREDAARSPDIPSRDVIVAVEWADEDLRRRGIERLADSERLARKEPPEVEVLHFVDVRAGKGEARDQGEPKESRRATSPPKGAESSPEERQQRPAGTAAERLDPPVLVLTTRLVPGRGTLGRLAASADPTRRRDAVGSSDRSPGTNLASLPLAVVGHREDVPSRAELDTRGRGRGGVDLSPWPHDFAGVLEHPEDVPSLEAGLLAAMGKPSDGFGARWINRKISTRISRLLLHTPVHPHHLTTALVALSLVDGALLIHATPAALLAGVLLYNAHSVLDGCDGELARARFQDSRSGAWFDTLGDQLANHLFLLALGIGLSRQPGLDEAWSDLYLWEGILGTAGEAASIWWISRITGRTSGAAHFREFGTSLVDAAGARGRFRRAARALVTLTRRDTYAWGFVFLALLGRYSWILHALAVGVAGHLIALLINAGRRWLD